MAGKRTRRAIVGAIGYGPALVWVALVITRYGPTRLGWAAAIGLAFITGLGILGLTGLVLAFLPAVIERLGFERVGAWLRGWWDEDAL